MKILYCILLTLLLSMLLSLGATTIFYNGVKDRLYTYSGVESFDTIEEAELFQHQIINESTKIGAIIDTHIKISSPPMVYFSVYKDKLEYFSYGTVELDKTPFRVDSGYIWGYFLASLIPMSLISIAFIYNKKYLTK